MAAGLYIEIERSCAYVQAGDGVRAGVEGQRGSIGNSERTAITHGIGFAEDQDARVDRSRARVGVSTSAGERQRARAGLGESARAAVVGKHARKSDVISASGGSSSDRDGSDLHVEGRRPASGRAKCAA